MDPITAALNFLTALMNLMALPENAPVRAANAGVLVKCIGLVDRINSHIAGSLGDLKQ